MSLSLGARGDTVRAVQKLLIALGYRWIGKPEGGQLQSVALTVDGVFGPQSESVIMDFQRDEGLLVDGVVGPQTMRALEAAYARRQVELLSPGSDALDAFTPGGQPLTTFSASGAASRMAFVSVPAEEPPGYEGGYPTLQLRADVAEHYLKLHAEVVASGAVLTSSGGKRGLDATVGEGRSATSMHYLGRALDLYIYSGMVDPQKDPYVIAMPPEGRAALLWRDGNLAEASDEAAKAGLTVEQAKKDRWFWRVWARCAEPAPNAAVVTIDNPVTYDDRRGLQTPSVTGHFVDLTALFKQHGFVPIRPRPRFFDFQGSMINAEWWHFQHEAGLVPGVSTFGGELLRVYSESRLANTPPWAHRHKVFGRDWG